MYGICINSKKYPFVAWILEKRKTVETRLPDKRTGKGPLDNMIDNRVGILETGTGKRAILKGYATISERITYDMNSFREDTRHCIETGSEYDIPKYGIKYGYVLTDIVALPESEHREITTGGIVKKRI